MSRPPTRDRGRCDADVRFFASLGNDRGPFTNGPYKSGEKWSPRFLRFGDSGVGAARERPLLRKPAMYCKGREPKSTIPFPLRERPWGEVASFAKARREQSSRCRWINSS